MGGGENRANEGHNLVEMWFKDPLILGPTFRKMIVMKLCQYLGIIGRNLARL